MKLKIKKLDKKASITKAHPTDAGWDLAATSRYLDEENGNIVYGTGIAVEIRNGFVGLVFPRSSNANKTLLLSNSVGVIDSGYRGEIMVKFKITASEKQKIYEIGDRIAQLIVIHYPDIMWEWVDELSETERGAGGYGSSGN